MEPYKEPKETPGGVYICYGLLGFATVVGIFGGIVGLDADAVKFCVAVQAIVGVVAINKWKNLAK